jgi:AcrR family transcriptional regulator
MAKEKEIEESRKTRYTRMALRDSIVELMEEKPVLSITVKDICERADISRSTFYAHYRDQYDLLQQTEQEILDFLDEILKRFREQKSLHETRSQLEEVLAWVANNRNSIQVFLGENGDMDFQKRFFARLTDANQIQPLIFHKEPVSPKIKEYSLAYIISGSVALIRLWLKNNMDLPIAELSTLMLRLIQSAG